MRDETAPPAATAHLVLVDVGLVPSRASPTHVRDDSLRGPRPPRLIRFSEVARQPLDRGRGSVRDIWTSTDADRTLRWQLRVVELRDADGIIDGPEGMHHSVVGFAGPQLGIRTGGSDRSLHRDEVLAVRSSTLSFSRPKLRASGPSSVIVLSHAIAEEPPTFAFREPSTAPGSPSETRILLALRSPIRLESGEAPRGSAVVLPPTAPPPRYR